jgi:hypothetical protein
VKKNIAESRQNAEDGERSAWLASRPGRKRQVEPALLAAPAACRRRAPVNPVRHPMQSRCWLPARSVGTHPRGAVSHLYHPRLRGAECLNVMERKQIFIITTSSTRTRAGREGESVGGEAYAGRRAPHGEGMHGTGSLRSRKREMTEISDFLAPRSSRPENNHFKILKRRAFAPLGPIASKSYNANALYLYAPCPNPPCLLSTTEMKGVGVFLLGPPQDGTLCSFN